MTSLFRPLLQPRAERGPEQHRREKDSGLVILKDQFSIQVWLSIGAIACGAMILAIGRIALLVPVIVIVARITSTLLTVLGLKHNEYKAGVIHQKFSAQLANPDGTFGPKPANQGIALLLIGTRSNHPLGLLAPGFREMGEHMKALQADVSARAADYGLLSSSHWLGTERAAGNEIMYAMYFRSADDIHRFAHDPLHLKAWQFYNALMADTRTDYSHLSIWHEIVAAPAGSWESIYVHSHPTLMGAMQVPVKSNKGQVEWHSAIVDATRGPLKSSRGRMAKADGRDNDKYGWEDINRSTEKETTL